MTKLPKEFFVWSFNDWDNWGGYARTTNLHPLDDKERETGVLCVPRSQADAMVAAAVKQAQYIAHIAWGWPESEASSMPVCEAISEITPADARSAFEQAVREAVEAERERITSIVRDRKPEYDGHQDHDRMKIEDAVVAVCEDIEAAIRAPQETSK